MIHSETHGTGKTLVFLHGFCEDHRIWNTIKDQFIEEYRCLFLDLPGFGDSELSASDLNIWAQNIWEYLNQQGIEKAYFFGHSLGGYVALAMTHLKPESVLGLGLIHSSAYADTEEKKTNRNKAIKHVQEYGSHAFVNQLIPGLYADPKHPGIPASLEIAKKQSSDGIIAALEAMRDRPDTRDVLRELRCPLLVLSGEQDALLDLDQQAELASLPNTAQFEILKGAGHMGMVEDPIGTTRIIKDFLSL